MWVSETPIVPPALSPGTLKQAARRQPEAQDAWFRADYPCVFRLCLGFLANATAAEELAQDAMIHLLDRLDRWNPNMPYEAWRTTVVLNLCRDHLRRQGTRQRAEGSLRIHPEIHTLPDPQDIAAAREIRTVVTSALAQLPPREREAFVLHDLEHRPTAEIATVMDITPSSVRSLLTLGRRRLRGILGPALAMESRQAQGGSNA